MIGSVIMVLAATAFIICRLSGVRNVVVARGESIRVTFDRPDQLLDKSYAVITLPLQPWLIGIFTAGLLLLIVVPTRL